MSCQRISNGFMCSFSTGLYEYKGFRFEMSRFGPFQINKDGELSKRNFGPRNKAFWKAFEEWQKLSKKEQEKYEL